MKTGASTVAQYLGSLPEDRRAALKRVRAVIRKHVPKGYEEALAWGMICWSVPLKVYPDTYNDQPLLYIALASQKNHMALHLMCAYQDSAVHQKLVAGFKAAGKKLDMGRSCIRFKKLDDLPLDVIAAAAAAVPVKRFVEAARAVHGKRK